MSTEVDVGTWGTIVLSPGQEQTWWFTWGFDSNHWVRFSVVPDSDQSSIQILSQWAEKDIHGGVRYLVAFRNNGGTRVPSGPALSNHPTMCRKEFRNEVPIGVTQGGKVVSLGWLIVLSGQVRSAPVRTRVGRGSACLEVDVPATTRSRRRLNSLIACNPSSRSASSRARVSCLLLLQIRDSPTDRKRASKRVGIPKSEELSS